MKLTKTKVNSNKSGNLNISNSEVETMYTPLNWDSLKVADSINNFNINIKIFKIKYRVLNEIKVNSNFMYKSNVGIT